MTKDLEKTCRDCKEHEYIPNGKNNDYCFKKEKFINYKKPCRDYRPLLQSETKQTWENSIQKNVKKTAQPQRTN